MALMGECQESASLRDMQITDLADDELRLFKLSSPTDMIDAEWIAELEGIIASLVKNHQHELKEEQKRRADSMEAELSSEAEARARRHQEQEDDAADCAVSVVPGPHPRRGGSR